MTKANYTANEAHRKLQAAKLGPTALGRLIGAPRQLAAAWLTGSVPSAKYQPAFAEKLGIAVNDWQTRPGARASVRPSVSPGAVSDTSTLGTPPAKLVIGKAPLDAIRHLDGLIAEVRKDRPLLAPRDRERSRIHETRLLEARERLRREAAAEARRVLAAQRVRRAEVLNHPAFKALEDELYKSFGELPGAADIVRRLEKERQQNGKS